jgi:hypothetical protein
MAEQELRARITADNKDFQKKTKQSERRGKNFAQKMKQYGGMIAGAFAINEVTSFVKKVVEATVQVGRFADRLGIGVEALQEINYAAKQFGVSTEAVRDGIKELTMRADEFAKTGKGPAAEVFERLGFTREQAEEMKGNTEELFNTVIDKISQVQNTAARQRIADELFGGEGGQQLVEMVSAGTAELEKFRKQARKNYNVLAEEDVERLTRWHKGWKNFGRFWSGLVKNLAADAVRLTDLFGRFFDALGEFSLLPPKKEAIDFQETIKNTEAIFDGLKKQTEETTEKTEEQSDAFQLGESSISAHKEQLKKLEERLKNLSPQQQNQIDNILEQRRAINQLLKDTLELQKVQKLGEISLVPGDMPSAEEMFGGTLGKEDIDMTMGGIIDDEGAMKLEESKNNLKDFSNMVIKSREEMSLAEQTAKKFGQQMLVSTKTGVDSIQEYGKAVANTARDAISAYLAMTVAKSIESAVGTGPLGLILAPIAAGAAATMFNSLVPEFAEGGAVTGPTLAMIGEGPGVNRSNPEYVGTADQISKMGGGKGYIAEASISMDELRIAIKESEQIKNNSL